jgi:mRNA interferase MazF
LSSAAPRRGDIVTISLKGDYGKPRPALILQSDAFDRLASVTVLPFSSFLIPAPLYRVTVHPSEANRLQKVSQIMVDKAVTVPRAKLGARIGSVEASTLKLVTEAFRDFFDL